MDLPDEIIDLILSKLTYGSLKQYAVTSHKNMSSVLRYSKHIINIIHIIDPTTKGRLTEPEIIRQIYSKNKNGALGPIDVSNLRTIWGKRTCYTSSGPSVTGRRRIQKHFT